MKHVVYKVFFLWDFEKEEKWLNEMAAKGLMLTDVGFCRYVLKKGHRENTNTIWNGCPISLVMRKAGPISDLWRIRGRACRLL